MELGDFCEAESPSSCKSSGAVRISVGMVTNFNDVQAFLSFARGLLG